MGNTPTLDKRQTRDYATHVLRKKKPRYDPVQEEDIVYPIRKYGTMYDVGSSHPGGEEAPKGLAVRQLKRYASWVQNVVRQFGLLSVAGAERCVGSSLVREDREG